MNGLLSDVKAGIQTGMSIGGYASSGILATFALGVITTAAASNPVAGSMMVVSLATAYAVGMGSLVRGGVVATSSVVGGVGGVGYGVYRFFSKPAEQPTDDTLVEVVVTPNDKIGSTPSRISDVYSNENRDILLTCSDEIQETTDVISEVMQVTSGISDENRASKSMVLP